ncbi:MAG: hypothetical protein ACD_77C00075G0008 [uncultured bacterium]|nr:MAG: hypothetical protein ACD_77C00075G0008 [uncultured bacterium]
MNPSLRASGHLSAPDTINRIVLKSPGWDLWRYPQKKLGVPTITVGFSSLAILLIVRKSSGFA